MPGRAVLADAVDFLKLLHGLDPGSIERSAAWPRLWSAWQFADRIRDDRLPVLAARMPRLAPPVDAFRRRYRNDGPPRKVVLHGDLVCEHLLMDPCADRLAGIIDFGDVGLGDPAHDLLGFWGCGASAAAHAVACYGECASDPTLLARSRNHFVRYRIDRLSEAIVDGVPAETLDAQEAALATLLHEP